MRMGEEDQVEEGEGEGLLEKGKTGLQKIRESMLVNARREKDRRDRAQQQQPQAEVTDHSQGSQAVTAKDDLSSLHSHHSRGAESVAYTVRVPSLFQMWCQ